MVILNQGGGVHVSIKMSLNSYSSFTSFTRVRPWVRLQLMVAFIGVRLLTEPSHQMRKVSSKVSPEVIAHNAVDEEAKGCIQSHQDTGDVFHHSKPSGRIEAGNFPKVHLKVTTEVTRVI